MDKYKKCINYLEASFYHEEGECSKGYSKKMCKDVSNCYYKQLLAEQTKNSELDATLKILKINHKLTMSELNNEQSKNKKMVEIINSIVKYCAKTDTIEWFDYDNIKAISEEVNNAK